LSGDTQPKPLRLSGSQPFTQQPGVYIMIGERTNVAGSPKFARLVKEGKFEEAVSVARQQVENGANVIDICMDEGMIDGASAMTRYLQLLASEPGLPEAERQEVLDRMVAQVAELSQLVAGVTELAKGEALDASPRDVRLAAVDLAEVAAAAVEGARRDWPQTVFTADLEPCVVRGHAERLKTAVRNLLDNAAKFGPPGSTVEVRLRAGELDLARVLRAAGDPVRLAIVRLLADDRERTCNELQAELELPSSTCSYHLRLLREAGFTRTRAQGTERRITLRRTDLDERFPGLLDALLL